MTPGNNGSPSNILNQGHLAQIKNGINSLQLAQREIDLAKRAGINVDAQQQKVNDAMDRLQKIQNTYFPGQ